MPNAALAVIFNHRYEQNLPKLRALYAARFPELFFVMPFARSKEADVIPVYESSYRFQSYLAQAWPTLERTDAEFFVFTGDDCILNPALNADTIASELGLDQDTAYTVEMIAVHDQSYNWPHLVNVLNEAQTSETYFAWKKEFPEVDEMVRRFERHGLKTGGLKFEERVKDPRSLGALRDFRKFKRFEAKGVLTPDFPLATGYSDLVVVPRRHMAEFANYCRAFASMGLFVEAAIPTALALALPRVKTEKTSDWKCRIAWGPAAVEELTRPMEKSMRKLAAEYGPRELAKHPVKLSAFENDLP